MNQTTPFLDPETARLLDPKIALTLGVIPLRRAPDGSIVAAMADPNDLNTLENLKVLLHSSVHPISRPLAEIHRLIDSIHGMGGGIFSSLTGEHLEESSDASMENSEAAMIRFVDNLLLEAARRGATDIHLEPAEKKILIRFRVDGMLKEIPSSPALFHHQTQLTARIKILGGMNVAERRLPQDGRFRARPGKNDFDIRVSTVPGLHGETVTMRLLPDKKEAPNFSQLGLLPAERVLLNQALSRPHGLILATGPTGHGKTTTLYACLSTLLSLERKVVTIEDPIEVRLDNATQIQARPEIGLTFHKGLRAILRQDPDVVMIGEIRDEETAHIAIRAALTGHLVLSTLHTNDAVSAAGRMMEMGVQPYLLSSALSLVIGQRLVRLTCPLCQGKHQETCPHCEGAGLKGRTGLFEVLSFNESLRTKVLDQNSKSALKEEARANGFKSLWERGRELAAEGKTTLAEVGRVVGEEASCV